MMALPTADRVRERGWLAAAGAVDGLAATAAMSGAMYGARRAGVLGKPPPRTIVERALGAAGARRVRRETISALAWIAHFAFGAAAGALLSLLRPPSPRARRAIPEGALFGAAVWAVSYAGWIPALGILPSPQRDRPGRPGAMLASHLVFGAALGALRARRRER